jgi:hypothetical protein
MKYNEIKYSRVFNLGDYQKEEISVSATLDEDATEATVELELGRIQSVVNKVSIPARRKAKAAQLAASTPKTLTGGK